VTGVQTCALPISEFISVYTRAEAIEDGVLVDVSDTAREAGFRFPVAITRTAFDEHVDPDPMPHMTNMRGRLWDVLNILKFVIRANKKADTILFGVTLNTKEGKRLIPLKAVCGGGDHGEPVITIMNVHED
jgi:hypothetical protein